MFKIYNHNHTFLGEFDTEAQAKREAGYYTEQTGNAAYVKGQNSADRQLLERLIDCVYLTKDEGDENWYPDMGFNDLINDVKQHLRGDK
jgi:hypothetical protein